MPPSDTETPHRIRSFIRRQGRMTPAQQNALNTFWETYCLDPDVEHDYNRVFGRVAPLVVEIGFGNGAALAEMAEANPERDFIGIEVHKPGVGHLMLLAQQKKLTNLRIFCHDAIEILEKNIPDNRLAAVHLFFPDPWPKKRHHKRRIVRDDFVEIISRKLKPGGYFHAATDWENYAEHMLAVLNRSKTLINSSPASGFCERPDYRPLTKFEKRGIRLGHNVWDLVFKKQDG